MLRSERIGIIDKVKVVLYSSQTPQYLTGLPVDFDDLVIIAKGNDQIIIIINGHRIHMDQIDIGLFQVNTDCIQRIEIIPAAPFKYEVLVFVKLLNILAANKSTRMSPIDKFTHIDCLRIIGDQQDMSVFHDDLMVIILIAVCTAQRIDHFIMFIQYKMSMIHESKI